MLLSDMASLRQARHPFKLSAMRLPEDRDPRDWRTLWLSVRLSGAFWVVAILELLASDSAQDTKATAIIEPMAARCSIKDHLTLHARMGRILRGFFDLQPVGKSVAKIVA
jgi:hypothetical protein